jgi:hypothetical protein
MLTNAMDAAAIDEKTKKRNSISGIVIAYSEAANTPIQIRIICSHCLVTTELYLPWVRILGIILQSEGWADGCCFDN